MNNFKLIASVLILFSSPLAGCTADEGYNFPSMTVVYSVDCECETLYVEFQTEDSLTYGFVTVDEGVWISDSIYFPESDYLRELYIYAADEDENGETTTLIILITLVDSRGMEKSDFDMIEGTDPDGSLYLFH